MQERDVGRIVVGVDDSLAGLGALRQAVELARGRGTTVQAVRAYRLPSDLAGAGWHAGLEQPLSSYVSDDVLAALKRQAAAEVVRAFDQAMGGVPSDVALCVHPTNRPLHRELVEIACQEDDLLVVAVYRLPHWWWPLRRSVARRCLARAVCPVLVVPAPQGARELGRWTPWRRLQRRRELADLLGGPVEYRRG